MLYLAYFMDPTFFFILQFKYLMHSSSIDLSDKGKKLIFSKSEKISKKSRNNGRGLCCRAAINS